MALRVGAAVQDGMDDLGRTASPVATMMARAGAVVEEHPLCVLTRCGGVIVKSNNFIPSSVRPTA